MTKLRSWIIALSIWLALFYNIERIVRPLNISKYFYTLVTGVVVLVLLWPQLSRLSIWLLMLVPTVLLVVMKLIVGIPLLGENFTITVTEVAGLLVSLIFARQIALHLLDFEMTLSQVAINYVGHKVEPLEAEQGIVYNELKRAKVYKRPLGLLALKFDPATLNQAVPRLALAYQQSLANQMAVAKVARVLDKELYDTDLLVQHNDMLLIVLPELDVVHLEEIGKRVKQAIETQTGLAVDIGAANYPADAPTFDGLLERARDRLQTRTGTAETGMVPGDA